MRDHPSPGRPAGRGPRPRTARRTGRQLARAGCAGSDLSFKSGKLGVHLALLCRHVELALDVVAPAEGVWERARVEQLVYGAGRRLHLGDLVLGTVERHAGVAIDSEMPDTASPIPASAFEAV